MPYNKNGLSSVVRESLPQAGAGFSLTKAQMEKLDTVAGVVLAVVAVAGVVALSAAAPNIFTVLKPLFAKKRLRFDKQKQRSVSQSFYYLKRSGLINIKPSKSDFKIPKVLVASLSFTTMVKSVFVEKTWRIFICSQASDFRKK